MKKYLKLFVASLLAATLGIAAAVAPSTITWNGAIPDATTLLQFLANPTFTSVVSNGTITPTGGVVPTGGNALKVTNIPIGSVALASVGTNTSDVNGQLWITDIYVPANITATGIGFLQGGTATTDNVGAAIYSPAGVLVASTSATILSGANTFKNQVFSSSQTIAGPATYYVVVQGNGTAAGAIQTEPAPYLNRTVTASGTYGSFPASITAPTSFVAGAGPVVYLY